MGESPGANRCGASALGIETSVFRHAAVHRMEHGPVPRAFGFDSRRRLRVGHAGGRRLWRRVEFETDDLRYEGEVAERLMRALIERPRRQFHFSNTGAFGVGECGLHQ